MVVAGGGAGGDGGTGEGSGGAGAGGNVFITGGQAPAGTPGGIVMTSNGNATQLVQTNKLAVSLPGTGYEDSITADNDFTIRGFYNIYGDHEW